MTTWFNLVAIAVGGAIGSSTRYLVTVVADAIPGGSTLWGTSLVNIVGCAGLGALAEYLRVVHFEMLEGVVSPRLALALRFGFLGGLTTFSTFVAESFVLVDSGRWLAAGLYVAGNFLLGLLAMLTAALLVKGWMT